MSDGLPTTDDLAAGPDAVTGAVLAGGASRRMGTAKAFLPGPDGRPLVVAALAALRAAGAGPLVVVARDPAAAAAFAGLEAPGPGGDGRAVAVLVDRVVDRGPLGGLDALLAAAPTPWSLVVACDMPTLDPALLGRVAARARASAAAAVVPRVAGRPEPLHAAWHRRAAPAIAAALAAGRLAVRELLGTLDVEWLDVAPDRSFDDWDTPEDVRPPPPCPRA